MVQKRLGLGNGEGKEEAGGNEEGWCGSGLGCAMRRRKKKRVTMKKGGDLRAMRAKKIPGSWSGDCDLGAAAIN